jgi:hypothetical protein
MRLDYQIGENAILHTLKIERVKQVQLGPLPGEHP